MDLLLSARRYLIRLSVTLESLYGQYWSDMDLG
jgi:hypothetical protein